MSVQKMALLMIIALLALAAVQPVLVGASNSRLLDAFDMDEALHLNLVRQALDSGNWHLEFSNYGHLYFNLCLLILSLLKLVTPVSDTLIIVILRAVPLLAAASIIGFTEQFARRTWNRSTALLSAAILALVPPHFFRFAVMSHPDLIQSLFLLLAVWSLIRFCHGEFSGLWLTALFSGLAFASKYGGLFMLALTMGITLLYLLRPPENVKIPEAFSVKRTLPRILWIAVSLGFVFTGLLLTPGTLGGLLSTDGHIDNPVLVNLLPLVRLLTSGFGIWMLLFIILELRLPASRLKDVINGVNLWVRLMIPVTVLFFAAFALTSPASLTGFNFVTGILYESHHTATGHIFIERPSPLIWLGYLANPEFYFGLPLTLVLAAGLIGRAVRTLKKKSPLFSTENILWIWVLFYLLFLMFRIQMARPRYLLTILPCLSILAAVTLTRFYSRVRCALHTKALRTGWFILAVCLITGQLISGSVHIARRVRSLVQWEQSDGAVRAGQWLDKNVPHDAVILADQFSYIPPAFQNVRISYYADVPLLRETDPDYIITNIRVTYAYQDSTRADEHRKGTDYFMTRYEYYHGLQKGTLGYRLLKDFDVARIYVKNTHPTRN